MTQRMVVAACALLGLIISTYLLLFSIGVIGELQCGTGSCERVQTSHFAVFLGLPVPLYGVGGYLALFGVAMVGVQPRWADETAPGRLLAALSTVAFGFTAYLNYAEFFIIRAICMWCTVSAFLVLIITLASWLDVRRTTALRAQPS